MRLSVHKTISSKGDICLANSSDLIRRYVCYEFVPMMNVWYLEQGCVRCRSGIISISFSASREKDLCRDGL